MPEFKSSTMLRACLVVCTTSFLIGWVRFLLIARTDRRYYAGTLATHWIADGLTLWKSPLTDAHLYTSAAYYSVLAQAPREMGITVSAVAVTGVMTILWSLWDGRAGNLMFDGASFCENNLVRRLDASLFKQPFS